MLALLRAGTPAALEVVIPSLGTVSVRLEPPARIVFLDGGIQGTWTVAFPAIGYISPVEVRLVPAVDPLHGTVRLDPEWAVPEAFPPGAVDLVPLLPSLELPRTLQGEVPGLADPAPQVRFHLQGLEVREDRLVIQFGLLTRR